MSSFLHTMNRLASCGLLSWEHLPWTIPPRRSESSCLMTVGAGSSPILRLRSAQATSLAATTRTRKQETLITRWGVRVVRSEEHTSELQSQFHLVCRLLLEKKKKNRINHIHKT